MKKVQKKQKKAINIIAIDKYESPIKNNAETNAKTKKAATAGQGLGSTK